MQDAPSSAEFRPIKDGEIQTVAEILQPFANQAILLWRNSEDILAHKDSFFVVTLNGAIAGCVAVHDYGNGLFELRSLAVEETFQGLGLGSFLVNGVIDTCKKRNAVTLFALTRKVVFFEKHGFVQESMDNFPEKVWKDCQLCSKRTCCDEKALAIRY